ncbi:FecR family protein [Bradyrhizobium ontarionense]|uniref:FecR family protein n=1 Tax=Bradyrhizobium ontarionense TaxID=2898149 RepID=A0ABY3RAI1_9BRAD|nr:FecR family protein [Bradyrhizobium sp. A19]UFZ04058.1 FecR family protein [Bradyrhizobium sp. A19]
MSSKRFLLPALIAACVLGATPAAFAADGEPWLVSKSSGDVWVASQGAERVSLGQEDALKPGDTIRTGPNGRVRLTRGAETIVVAPNSEVGLPTAAKDGMATTILQRAGSILLDVEKRNVQHFEVETPYLAAVVKGTQFSVTISGRSTKVEVSRGQVQVSDFKTGQIAQVLPGQAATTFANGGSGLSLSGAGTFSPIEQGRPRTPTIDRVPVPRDGLHAPRETKGSVIHALNAIGAAPRTAASASPQQHSATTSAGAKPNVVRISTSIGEVNLNIQKATRGLAHGAHAASGGTGRSTAWSEARSGNGNTPSNAATSNGTSGDPSVAAAVTAAIGSPTASATTSLATVNSGGDSGNGSSGGKSSGGGNSGNNGNGGNGGNSNGGSGNSGHGNGNSGNNGNGNGNGNSGHGNSGHGNGNAYAYGHNKN